MRIVGEGTTCLRSPQVDGIRVATLGPEGTDAHAEALRIGARVDLHESFPAAMAYAARHRGHALIAAGYIDPTGPPLARSWVDLHFSYLRQLHIQDVWEARTKPMCVAVRARGNIKIADIESVALHPSTWALVAPLLPTGVATTFVRAKPSAVRSVLTGETDACVGSVDVVEGANLEVLRTFTPTMVWCLYRAVDYLPTSGDRGHDGSIGRMMDNGSIAAGQPTNACAVRPPDPAAEESGAVAAASEDLPPHPTFRAEAAQPASECARPNVSLPLPGLR